MVKKILAIVFASFFLPVLASAASPDLVLSGGTIYKIENNQKRGFPSPAVLFSHGYGFFDASPGVPGESAGALMTYAEGALVKGTGATVYLISEGKKRAFASKQAFLNLGYSFKSVLADTEAIIGNVPDGAVIDESAAAHPAGTLVNDNGTVYLVDAMGKKGIPSVEVFNSYRFTFSKVVPANSADLTLTDLGLINQPQPPPVPPPAPAPTPAPVPAPEPLPPADNAPVVDIQGYKVAFTQTTVSFKITATDDNGGNIALTLNWGDGGSVETKTMISGETLSISHSWQFIGNYQITATAADSAGTERVATKKIIVDNDTSVFGPALTLLSPNGGEKIKLGSVIKIKWVRNWEPQGSLARLNIAIKRLGGGSESITTGVTGESYDWTPYSSTNVPGDDYKISIISHGFVSGELTDESDSVFSLISQ